MRKWPQRINPSGTSITNCKNWLMPNDNIVTRCRFTDAAKGRTILILSVPKRPLNISGIGCENAINGGNRNFPNNGDKMMLTTTLRNEVANNK